MENARSLGRTSLPKHKMRAISRFMADNLLLLGPVLFVIGIFIYLLRTSIYMYYFYILAGVMVFLLSQKLGKHLYLYLVLLMISFSAYLNKPVYNLHYYNDDGLNKLGLHPITIILLTAMILELIILIQNRKFNFDMLFLTGFLTIVVFSIVTLIKRGFNGFPIIITNYLGPILLIVFYNNVKGSLQKEKIQTVLRVFLITAFFIGIFGLAEYFLQWNPLRNVYRMYGWNYQQQVGQYRILTILGHPLDNASYFLSAMAAVSLCVGDRRLKYLALLFFTAAILITGSRSMFALAILMMLFSNNRGCRLEIRELAPKIAAVALVLALFYTPLGNTIVNRMNTVEGVQSTQARVLLVQYFLDNYKNINLRGIGSASESVKLVDSTNSIIILENPWIILFIEVSYLFLIYVVFLFFVLRKTSSRWGIYMLILAISSANSFGVKGDANYEFFFILTANMLYTWFAERAGKEVSLHEQ